MLPHNTALSEYTRLIEGVSDDTVIAADPLESGWHKAETTGCRRFLGLCAVTGEWTDAETLTFRWAIASDAAGTGAATVKEIVRDAHATANDNILMMMDMSHLDYTAAKPFCQLSVLASSTGGGAAALMILGGDMRYTPQDDSVTGKSTDLVEILRGATGT